VDDNTASQCHRLSQSRARGGWQDRGSRAAAPAMAEPERSRPRWLNWLYLLIFLWSSWQLAGIWIERLHG